MQDVVIANPMPAPVPASFGIVISVATPAPPVDLTLIPAPVRAMLDAAMASGNDGEVTTIARYAITAAPAAADRIRVLVAEWHTARDKAQRAVISNAGPLDLWKGKLELTGFISSGNTNDAGLSGSLDLTRETLRWRQKLRLATDYQRSAGVVSREHYLASYEPNFKFSPRGYIYGAAQYESDHFLGYDNRYSVSFGAGYSAIKEANLKLDLEVGPAYRYTEFSDLTVESSPAARGSLDFGWKLNRAVSFTQVASAYVEEYNSTVSSTTALSAKVLGPLSATLSYAVQYESLPPVGRVSTDTTSRAGIVYSF